MRVLVASPPSKSWGGLKAVSIRVLVFNENLVDWALQFWTIAAEAGGEE